MSAIDLEEGLTAALQRRAAELPVVPTDTARQGVQRHVTRRHRRRRAGRVALGTLLVVAVLGIALSTGSDDEGRGNVRTDDPAGVPGSRPPEPPEWEPPAGSTDRVPALTLDALGLQPIAADDNVDEVDVYDEYPPYQEHLQVFRVPGSYTGPTVHLSVSVNQSGVSSRLAPTGANSVDINGHPAWLGENDANAQVMSLMWNDDTQGDGEVTLISRDLTTDELVAFARGLQPRPDGITFRATVLPRGMAEDPTELSPAPPSQVRQVRLQNAAGVDVRISIVHGGGNMSFVERTRVIYAESELLEQVVIAGRPAILSNPPEGPWYLEWRLTTTDHVSVTISHRDAPEDDDGSLEPDRATVDAIADGIREIDESEWQDLLDQVGQ